MNSLVSIIIPCYNQAKYLPDALESVLNQSYANWECIIINDGSPDNTDDMVKLWLQKDLRFKYLKTKNQGVCKTRNFGIENANGEFILPLDADDYLSSNYVEACVSKMGDNNLKVIYGKAIFFGEQTGELSLLQPTLQNLLKQNCIHCSGLFRKLDWRLNNGYDDNMNLGFEDWEFWVNMLKRGGQALLLESCVLHYRIKTDSRSTGVNSNSMTTERMTDYIFRKHINLYGFSSSYQLYIEKIRLQDKLRSVPSNYSSFQLIKLLFKRIWN